MTKDVQENHLAEKISVEFPDSLDRLFYCISVLVLF